MPWANAVVAIIEMAIKSVQVLAIFIEIFFDCELLNLTLLKIL
jgi:hypothetical protein